MEIEMVVIAVEIRWKVPVGKLRDAKTLHNLALALRALAVDVEKLSEKVPDEVEISLEGYGADEHILIKGEALTDK